MRVFSCVFVLVMVSGCVVRQGINEDSLIAELEADSMEGEPTERAPGKVVGRTSFALLADSQLQTPRSVRWTFLMAGKPEDRVVNVSMRMAGLELFAPSMLRYFLERTADADMVLYLGDAANNGCADEIEQVLTILREAQATRPVFFVIGNHDYLGRGNTDVKRRGLCDDDPAGTNRALEKWEVIERAHRFNARSAELARAKGWQFTDSADIATAARCRSYQAHYSKCFYSATLWNPTTREEVLLVDTSDYERPRVLAPHKRWWGTYGNVSKEQVAWLAERTRANTPNRRVIASHYHLDSIKKKFYRGVNVDAIIGLLEAGRSSNVTTCWLTAHSHARRPVLRARSYRGRTFDELNVGSTTDWNPHAVVVSCGPDGIAAGSSPVRWIDTEALGCARVHQLIQREAEATGRYQAVAGRSDPDSIFGLNRLYRVRRYDKRVDRRTIERNVAQLRSIADADGFAAESVALCLGQRAAALEKGVCPLLGELPSGWDGP